VDSDNSYGIWFEGTRWKDEPKALILKGAELTEQALIQADLDYARARAAEYHHFGDTVQDWSSLYGLETGQAWQAIFRQVSARLEPGRAPAITDFDSHSITFHTNNFDPDRGGMYTAVHEFGHLFANAVGKAQGIPVPYRDLQHAKVMATITEDGVEQEHFVFGGQTRTPLGYQQLKDVSGTTLLPSRWEQHRACCGEDFADMFLNWTLGSFAEDAYGAARSDWISERIPGWIALTVKRT
jgi:hypothetical protein